MAAVWRVYENNGGSAPGACGPEVAAVSPSPFAPSLIVNARRFVPLTVRVFGKGVKVHGHRLYAPSVIIKAGVLNEMLVKGEELEATAFAWNGRPVTLNHPQNDKGDYVGVGDSEAVWDRHVLGFLLDAEYSGKGIRSTMVLEQPLMAHVGGLARKVYRGLRAGQSFDVSTGYWAHIEPEPGELNGKPYFASTKGIVPDHVAILPEMEGACSRGDGCGVPRTHRKQVSE